MLVIPPKHYVDTTQSKYLERSLYFIAGPVRGGGDWQYHMLSFLKQYDPDAIVAIPNRWKDATLAAYLNFAESEADRFERQLDFERHYMEQAAWEHPRGCLIFYLARQIAPRPAEDGPYAQDTYGEFGRWAVHKHYQPHTRLVVGADPKFFGLDCMVRNLRADAGYDVPIHESWEATARAAAALANE